MCEIIFVALFSMLRTCRAVVFSPMAPDQYLDIRSDAVSKRTKGLNNIFYNKKALSKICEMLFLYLSGLPLTVISMLAFASPFASSCSSSLGESEEPR